MIITKIKNTKTKIFVNPIKLRNAKQICAIMNNDNLYLWYNNMNHDDVITALHLSLNRYKFFIYHNTINLYCNDSKYDIERYKEHILNNANIKNIFKNYIVLLHVVNQGINDKIITLGKIS